MGTVLLVILAIVLLLIGIGGTVFPALPGLPLMFAGAWLLAYAEGYEVFGWGSLVVILILVVLGMLMDFLAGMLGARYTGASKLALWGTFVGGVVGMFFSLIGIVLGPLLGAAVGEWFARRDLLKAGKVGFATFIGFVVGTVTKIGMALSIVLVILGQYLVFWWRW